MRTHAPKFATENLMKNLSTMVRGSELDAALDFYCNKMGMVETRRTEYRKGRRPCRR